MWLRQEVEALLLAMRIRPFLSHKREEQRDVLKLRHVLQTYGAGGWKDTEDLRLGAHTPDEIRDVIRSQTGGFIWWGTRSALTSEIITRLEIPEALDRARREAFPVVPVFVDLRPRRNRRMLQRCIPRVDELLAFNGVVAETATGGALYQRIAKRYVGDAVSAIANDRIRVAFRALSAPSGEADITFDWRGIFDGDERLFKRGGAKSAVDALGNLRTSVQRREQTPRVDIDADLPLPLSYLVGYEWREPTRLRLAVRQRTGTSYARIALSGRVSIPVASRRVVRFPTNGPSVLAISCGRSLERAADEYARTIRASKLSSLHVDGVLDAKSIRGLAAAGAQVLRELGDRGVEKHLLILGPSVLAVALGAASNAVGPVTLPFWHERAMRYVNPITAASR